MTNFLDTISKTAASLPKTVTKTVQKVLHQAAALPSQAAHAANRLQDTVHISGKPQHTEVNRRQMQQAARPQARAQNAGAPGEIQTKHKPAHNGAAPAKVRSTARSGAASMEVIQNQSPAKQRAYFAQLKAQKGKNFAQDVLRQNEKNGRSLEDILINSDTISMQAVGDLAKNLKGKAVDIYRSATGTTGVHAARETAKDLEQKQIGRWEQSYAKKNPQRYAHYKANQVKDQATLTAEADGEIWKRRELKQEEEARTQALLGDNLKKYDGRLSERHRQNVARAEQSIVDGNFRKDWHAADAVKAARDSEKVLVPNKAEWLKTLSPQARQTFLQRQAKDMRSVLKSGVESGKQDDNWKDTFTLGLNKIGSEEGWRQGLAEVATLGTYSMAKAAGSDLGQASAYYQQAGALEKGGYLNQSDAAGEVASEKAASGALNAAFTGLSVVGLARVTNNMSEAVMRRMRRFPASKVEVVSAGQVRNSAMPGTTSVADEAARKSAKDFEALIEGAYDSGVHHRIRTTVYRYEEYSDRFFGKRYKAVPQEKILNVFNAETEMVDKMSAHVDSLPAGGRQSLEKLDDIFVADVDKFLNADGTITSGLNGAARTETGEMLLNRTAINAPMRKFEEKLAAANARNLKRGVLTSAMEQESMQNLKGAAQKLADENLKRTFDHEAAHFHYDRLGLEGSYAAASGPAYSSYSAECGNAAEDFAEGWSKMLSRRRQLLDAHGPNYDWAKAVLSDPAACLKDRQIVQLLEEPLVDIVDGEMIDLNNRIAVDIVHQKELAGAAGL